LNIAGEQQQPIQEDGQDHYMLQKSIPPYKPSYLQNSILPRKEEHGPSPAHFHQQPSFENKGPYSIKTLMNNHTINDLLLSNNK